MRLFNDQNLLERDRGFTLVEILVVIAIIALILSVAVVNYSAANIRNRDGKRMADIEQIRSALEMYRADNPTTGYPAGNYAAAMNTLVTNNYLRASPTDPLDSQGYRYYYAMGGAGSTYNLCARLEGTSSLSCPVAVACGTVGNCTYGQRQP